MVTDAAVVAMIVCSARARVDVESRIVTSMGALKYED